MRLLITDLDNTLYDWVGYYAHAFRALSVALGDELGVDREVLLDEFKAVHQQHGDSEYPLAPLELPAVRARYGELSESALRHAIRRSLSAFDAARAEHLHLYDGVASTLSALRRAGVVVVGHTEAMAENAYHRLEHLGVRSCFRRLYALEGVSGRYADPRHMDAVPGAAGFIRLVPRAERKPNPRLVADICEREGVRREETWYVGDSLARDVSMAKTAGVRAVWARYGTDYDRELWSSLVRITHWTDRDVAREAELRRAQADAQPDFVIESFAELLNLLGVS